MEWRLNHVGQMAQSVQDYSKGNKKYSKELKQQAVLDYLAGYGSQDDICKK